MTGPGYRAPLLLSYYVGLHGLVLLALWRGSSGGVAPGVVLISVIPLGLAVPYILSHIVRPMSRLDSWVLAYAVWSVGSIVLYAQAGNPSHPAAYAYGVYSFVLPIACYFAGKSVPRDQRAVLVTGLICLHAFVVAYGLYLHVARPAYYTDFLTRALTSGGATQEWQYYARLQSYLGSTLVGYIATTGIVLATLGTAWMRRALPLLALLFTAGALLSLQRASLLALVIALGYLVFASRQHRGTRLLTVVGFVGAIGYGSLQLGAAADPIRERVQERATTDVLQGFSRFFEERGYKPALQYLSEFPLGVGLGGTSSAADNAGHLTRPEVADANFMRIAADLGVLGLGLFLLVLVAAFGRAWRSPNRIPWLSFLTIHCGIMLSTNVLDSYYISQGFWLLLAVLDQDRPATEPRSMPSSTEVPAPLAVARG